MPLSPNDWQQVHHVAQLAVLSMACRAVASSESENEDGLEAVIITVTDARNPTSPIHVEFYGPGRTPLGGMSL